MDSNSKQDVELAKKSCEKACEIIKSKRRAALALITSIGICLTLVVVTFVIGSLFGYYLVNLQMLPIEQNVETVKEGKTETNFTIGEMQKLAQQLEVENNQTTISTTTQISTTTSTTTDENLTERRPHFNIRISFDTDENEETEKKNVVPKVNQKVEITPIWNEIIEILEPLEPRELLERPEPDVQQISTNTRRPATDEELTRSKIRISLDSDENDETEKVNVNPKEDRMDGEKIPSWDEIFVNSGTLEKLEPDDAQPTSTTNQEDLTQTEDGESKVLNTVFKTTENDEPEEYDYANNDQKDDNVDKESISLELTTQESNFLETTTQKPNTLKFEFTPGPINERWRIFIEGTKLGNRFDQFINDIFRCPWELSLECSAPAHRMDIVEQRKHIGSIISKAVIYNEFDSDEHRQLASARIENAHRQFDEIFDRIRSTPLDLCADHSDYDKCQSCVKQKADCLYSSKDTCKTQIEWNIIGYTPKFVEKQCYAENFEIFYQHHMASSRLEHHRQHFPRN